MKPKVAPLQQERELHLHELFFSTTDKKGIIRSCNDVFVRVSDYAIADMIGQPHNLIRHPDMPRTIFKLLWDHLHADQSIVAYVKNLARDGRYYWVVALVLPLSDGYLSIRCKPSSEIFPVVQELYQQLVALENNLVRAGKTPKDAMQAATQKLDETLHTLGFATYDAFMHSLLREELKSREQKLRANETKDARRSGSTTAASAGESTKRLARVAAQSQMIAQTLSQLFSKLDDFVLLGSQLEKQVGSISDLAQGMRILSLNTGIASARLKIENEVLISIANLMGENSKQLNASVSRMGEHLLEVSATLKGIVYDLAAARLQLEMLHTFLLELLGQNLGQTAVNDEFVPRILMLQDTFAQTYRRAVTSFQGIETDLSNLNREGTELQRAVQTLQFVHLVGRVEISRQTQLAGFEKILEEVLGKIQTTRSQLESLSEAIAYLSHEVNGLGKVDRRVSQSLQMMQADTQWLEQGMGAATTL